MNEPISTSGYTPCACRDCMDVTVSSDWTTPELCSECADAGCVAGQSESDAYDCLRADAYGDRCGTCGPDHECPTDDLCLACLARATGKGE